MFQAVMQLDSAIPHNKKLAMAQDLIARAGLQGKVCMYVGRGTDVSSPVLE